MAFPMQAGTVDDLIADAKTLGEAVTQRMIMDWQSVGLLDYPVAQGGKGRGHGSKKSLYSGNQRRLFHTLLEKRAETAKIVDLTKLPVYLWIYWGDEYVPLRQMRRALRFYVDKALKPSRDSCQKSAAAIVVQFRHEEANQTHVTKLQRLLSEAMYLGRGFDDSIKAEIHAVFDPLGDSRTIGPPGAQLSVDVVVGNAMAMEIATIAISRNSPDVTDELLYVARQRLCETMITYLRDQPNLALHAGRLTQEFAPVTLQDQVSNCRSDLLLNLGLCMMKMPQP